MLTITALKPGEIFVFGSNTQGRHGKGAALWAYQHAGAIYGWPRGPQGRSYAICTKDLTKRIHPSVSQSDIEWQIHLLYGWARMDNHLHQRFLVAYTTQPNLNGYTPQQMADMFCSQPIPDNMVFEEQFSKLIQNKLPAHQKHTS
jgi:hypothetical protein